MLVMSFSSGGGHESGAQTGHLPVTTTGRAPTGSRVLYPPDRSVLAGGKVQVIAVTDKAVSPSTLAVDGKPLDARKMSISIQPRQTSRPAVGPNKTHGTTSSASVGTSVGAPQTGRWVLLATAELTPGSHRLELDRQTVHVFGRGPGSGDPPKGWSVFRPHPPAGDSPAVDACSACHEVARTTKGLVLGDAREPDACFACHPRDDFGGLHPPHRLEVLSACRTCHDPHGGSRASLLKDETKVLCTTCHEQ